jgi:hypothetical protein
MKNLTKIDRFYGVVAIVFTILAGIVLFTARGLFSAMNKERDVDQSLLNSKEVRVSKQSLDQALDAINKKEVVPLDLK